MFEFKLPDVGEGVAEGEIVAWHVAVGDAVEEDEVVAEVETDKAVVDVPIPVEGTVQELHAEVGDVLPVGETLITIDTGEGEEQAVDDAAGEEATGEAAPPSEPGPGESAGEGLEAAPGAPGPSGDGEEPEVPTGRIFASPRVRRLAREAGVDLAAVEGSGPGGRVTETDVRTAAAAGEEPAGESPGVGEDAGEGAGVAAESVETAEPPESGTERPAAEPGDAASGAGAAAATAPVAGGVEPADRDRTLAVPATRALAADLGVDIDAVPTDETRDGEPFVTPAAVRSFAEAREAAAGAEPSGGAAAGGPAPGGAGAGVEAPAEAGTVEPYRGVRRTIGEKMEESKYTAPHVSHHDSVDVSALVDARAAMKERAEERGVKLTYVPFVLKALVAGLREYPILNSELDEEAEEIRIKGEYNVGVATATDAGLMVPVVKHVDQKGILQLASEVNELTRKARERSISLAEMQGGTVSITNFGAIGGEYATPIINYPETAILGLGAIEERPWVVDGEVVARPVLPLSLSIDHRVIDGAEAAQFTNTVMEYLANPSLLLLDG